MNSGFPSGTTFGIDTSFDWKTAQRLFNLATNLTIPGSVT